MNIDQLYDAARQREAEVADERQRWRAIFADAKPDVHLPLDMTVASLGTPRPSAVTPTFLLPPWDNSDGLADPDVMIEWSQEPEARIQWFNDHPNAGSPIGFSVKYDFVR